MATTLFPSNRHLPFSSTLRFPLYFNPFVDLYASTSVLLKPVTLRNPKPIPPSKLSKSLFLCPAVTTTVTVAANTNSNGENTIMPPNPDSSSSSKPPLLSEDAIKMPTPPWMKGPILLHPSQVLDFSKQRDNKNSTNSQPKKSDPSLMDKVSGGRGKKAMKKIFQGIGKLQQAHDSGETQKDPGDNGFDFPFGELEENKDVKFAGKMPWERDERVVFRRTKKEKVVTAAELSIDKELLERLRREAARMRKWVKVKKAGVNQTVVNQVCLIWNNNELAMLKFDLPLRRNMDRAREIVESKTGGLVIWCKKDTLVVYRGCEYIRSKTYSKTHSHASAGGQENSLLNICPHKLKGRVNLAEANCDINGGEEQMSWVDGKLGYIPVNGSLYEREADRLLDGLGPRYIDWWRPKPLPVDADLLPEVVPGYKPPFRRCPPHARAKLKDDELTYLRKLARPLPFHFVLGRNRKLQGLAAAILKLWEKCHIVKIAVKWGIPNTDNAQMADELKYLTGGVLLLRNKFLIILYRGKDFLPCRVAGLVADREMELRKCQLQEEAARLKATENFDVADGLSVNSSTTGTLSEFKDIQSDSPQLVDEIRELEVQMEAEKQRLEKQLRNQKRKLHILKMKIERSEKELAKLNSTWMPAEEDVDQELITQEERECYRKIGLKMDSTLVLGRRGVFDGVIEGLHQHWKHKEIVKVITMQRLLSQVIYTAKQLETESGGILVSVDKLKEGHAIIIYRGKNYRRPLISIPQNLLNKIDALHRSLEMQRIGSLKFFAHQRQLSISELNSKLVCLEKRRIADQREADEVE